MTSTRRLSWSRGNSLVDAKTQVTNDKKVISFLGSCGEPNLQFLLQPKRLEKALKVLDTSQDGEIDADECTARRLTCHSIDATPARRRGGAVL